MTDRPILFSAPMVKSLLDGRKTQTRRIINLPGVANVVEFVHVGTDSRTGVPVFEMKDAAGRHLTRPTGKGSVSPHYSPRFAKGDRLYVRETWSAEHLWSGVKPSEIPCGPIWYWADGEPREGDWTKPKVAIHMPRWASRLTLTVTDMRVQRLQEISEADALAEGVTAPFSEGYFRTSYRDLWNVINGAGAWDANPWIVAVSFSVERRNIDAARAA
ncbi:hypothetical protein [Reyranella sp.]|uniref:hypothetical protein n=1 Tax=Reyranella sp. TaxID=1929291 RepID=UPI0040361CA6